MSLTIKHLNDDASFLITFRPTACSGAQHDFTIILDPWLEGESTTFHSKFSTTRSKRKACVSSLTELPEPNLVIISQDKTDHCHAQTLKALPPRSKKTIILAEAASARIIRGWKHFSPDSVKTMPKYDQKRYESIYRISLPSLSEEGSAGEVTITFIPQKLDVTALHSAVCITYLPPTNTPMQNVHTSSLLTPPASPMLESLNTPNGVAKQQPLSVIFSPHGLAYSSLQPFVESCLSPALPLTALLHCFDRIDNPWYLGGNICSGMLGGAKIAQNLRAKVWISAHDGDKDTKGMATTRIVTTKYKNEEIEVAVGFETSNSKTQICILDSGEEKTIT